MAKIATYREFWPFYLSEHRNLTSRALHLIGTGLALALLIAALLSWNGWLVLAAVISGYAFAWTGHMRFEKNRPATFRYPLWSLISDVRMFLLWCGGRLEQELERQSEREMKREMTCQGDAAKEA